MSASASNIPSITQLRSAGKAVLKAVKSDNPYRVGGAYHAVVEALRSLGKGKFHSAADLVKAFPKAMGKENFNSFKAVKPRNAKTGKDVKGRIIQNALVLVRPDYGRPLREMKWEVRYERTEDGYRFGLFPFKGRLQAISSRGLGRAKSSPGFQSDALALSH